MEVADSHLEQQITSKMTSADYSNQNYRLSFDDDEEIDSNRDMNSNREDQGPKIQDKPGAIEFDSALDKALVRQGRLPSVSEIEELESDNSKVYIDQCNNEMTKSTQMNLKGTSCDTTESKDHSGQNMEEDSSEKHPALSKESEEQNDITTSEQLPSDIKNPSIFDTSSSLDHPEPPKEPVHIIVGDELPEKDNGLQEDKVSEDIPSGTNYSSGIPSINKDMYNISGCSIDSEDPSLFPDNLHLDHQDSNVTETTSLTESNPEISSDSVENLHQKLEQNSSSVNLFEPSKSEIPRVRSESRIFPSRHIVHPYHWKQLDSTSKSSIFDSSIDISFSHDTDHEDHGDLMPSPGNIDKQWFKTHRTSSSSLDPPEYFEGFGHKSWGSQCQCYGCITGEKYSDSGNDTGSYHQGLLQSQLDKTEKDSKRIQDELRKEIKELKKDNERQQKLIGQNLSLGPEAKIEATMQHEITRLTSENLDLREMIDDQTQQIRKLKKVLKVYSKKLRAGEAAEIQAELEKAEIGESNGSLATVKHRERSFMGMLELKKEDENVLIKNLVLDLKPKVAAGLIPGLPAYILFMIVRQTDFTNDDEKVRGLLTNTINGIKKVVKRHNDDLDRITLWLANTCRLLHTLKQYSGEKAFQTENTPKQNEQCLRNFDLSEYRQVFSDLAVWIYQGLLKRMEELIQPSIVPAILEHEAISGLNASKPSGLRGRSSSSARELDSNDYSLDSLMRSLYNYMRIVTKHAVDPELGKQIFRQVFYYICAGSLNNLLLRKDVCNWSKGMQIRYNLSYLEQWSRINELSESGAITALDPIIQASQLLQGQKTDSDVDSIIEKCSKLTNAQIVKILNLYTPVDEFEERVPISFIRKIQEKLKSRDDTNNTLLMDTKYSYPVTFPFNPSNIELETIEVPDILHLSSIIKKV